MSFFSTVLNKPKCYAKLIIVVIFFSFFKSLYGYELGLQLGATAANAGGQSALAIRGKVNTGEWSLFHNSYLSTSEKTLIGLGYNYPVFEYDAGFWFSAYTRVGGGISTAGPLIEILWGTKLVGLRMDIATHVYFVHNRPVTWSFPLWIGFSLLF